MSKWHHAIQVLQDMQCFDLQPDVACMSTLMENMVLHGGLPGAIALYRAHAESASDKVWIARLARCRRSQGFDLHRLTAELARIAVRVKLLDIATAMTSTEFWRNPQKHGLQEDGSLYFIVGLGQHSKTGESILGPSVLQMLEQEFGLHAHYHPKNEALLRIPKHQLVRFVEDRSGLLEKKKNNA